jgi:hypothetical protein
VLIRLASKRPWRLDHDDLVTLVRTIPHGRGDTAKLSREELLSIADMNQVGFEVRFFQVVPGPDFGDLITLLTRDFPKAALQALKVATFEVDWAFISIADGTMEHPLPQALRTAGDHADDARPSARLDGLPPGPDDELVVTNRLQGGLHVQLTALRRPWGHAVQTRFLGTLPGDPTVPNASPRNVERLV